MNKKEEIYSNIFNNFINDISDTSYNNNNKRKNKRHSKHNNEIKYDKKNEEKDKENNNMEEIIQIKLIKLENEKLMEKIKEKEVMLDNYKRKYNEQKYKLLELQKQIKEITDKEKEKIKFIPKEKEKNKNNFIPKEKKSNNFINDKFEENLALKAVEDQIFNELNSYINKTNKEEFIESNRLDRIENIKFNIDNSTFFQCGICMDTFQDGEQLKKLSCSHIYHKDCLNQWIQAKKDCPLCGKFIYI